MLKFYLLAVVFFFLQLLQVIYLESQSGTNGFQSIMWGEDIGPNLPKRCPPVRIPCPTFNTVKRRMSVSVPHASAAYGTRQCTIDASPDTATPGITFLAPLLMFRPGLPGQTGL
jgi:hypothetical protein